MQNEIKVLLAIVAFGQPPGCQGWDGISRTIIAINSEAYCFWYWVLVFFDTDTDTDNDNDTDFHGNVTLTLHLISYT